MGRRCKADINLTRDQRAHVDQPVQIKQADKSHCISMLRAQGLITQHYRAIVCGAVHIQGNIRVLSQRNEKSTSGHIRTEKEKQIWERPRCNSAVWVKSGIVNNLTVIGAPQKAVSLLYPLYPLAHKRDLLLFG